jgi:myo-inositol-1(or 4)-monophosphatase
LQATDLALITDAIRMAGRIATSYVGQSAQTWDKPGGAGPVTEADLAVNSYLETVLKAARPGYGWLSEETEDTAARLSRDTVFIIDPIDGTRSFVEGSRTWAHSIAVAHKGVVTAGAIYLPMRDLLYTAMRGEGAWLNSAPLAVSSASSLQDAAILAARPVTAAEHWRGGPPAFKRSHRPSLAYRLGLVGQGRFDAMLTFRPTWEWDVAAGTVIVEEAAGTCTDRKGMPLLFNNPIPQLDGMIASGASLHAQLMQALHS